MTSEIEDLLRNSGLFNDAKRLLDRTCKCERACLVAEWYASSRADRGCCVCRENNGGGGSKRCVGASRAILMKRMTAVREVICVGAAVASEV